MGKKVLLILTGGTIGGQTANKHDANNVMLEFVNKHKSANNIDVVDSIIPFDPIDSAEIEPWHWKKLSNTIYEKYEDYDSFIIAHGTNTMIQTAMALSLALGNIAKPVILTGSQKPFDHPRSDAITNFGGAFELSAYDEKQIKGVVIVFQNRIISGINAIKTSNKDNDAFSTFGSSSDLGNIDNGITIRSDDLEKHNSNFGSAKTKSELDVQADFDDTGALQSYDTHVAFQPKTVFDDMKYKPYVKAFIFSFSGDGDPNMKRMRACFEEMKNKRIPCVATSHSANGTTYMTLNDPGNIARFLGVIPSGELNHLTANVKMLWLIAQGCKYENFAQAMSANRNEVIKYFNT